MARGEGTAKRGARDLGDNKDALDFGFDNSRHRHFELRR